MLLCTYLCIYFVFLMKSGNWQYFYTVLFPTASGASDASILFKKFTNIINISNIINLSVNFSEVI